MFDKLVWHKDRVLLEELVFRLEHYRSEAGSWAMSALSSTKPNLW